MVSSYVPLVDTTVYGLNRNVKEAFYSFFDAFDKTIENYIKDKDDIERMFREQIKNTSLEEMSQELDKDNEMLLSIYEDLKEELTEDNSIGDA